MSKFYNSSRGSVSATIGGEVAVFAPKKWTTLADDIELSSSMKSLLDQGILIPAVMPAELRASSSSKPRTPAPKKSAAPAKVEAKADAKPEAKPEAKIKDDRPLSSSDKK